MHETHTTQVQFPSPGQRRRLMIASIAALLIVSVMVVLGRGTTEHRATPRVYLRDVAETPVTVIDTEAPETVLSDWDLQAAVDDFCVNYRSLFDLDPATGERPLPRGCSGSETRVDFELGIDDALAIVPR